MKTFYLLTILIVLLLTGCGAAAPQEDAALPAPVETTVQTQPSSGRIDLTAMSSTMVIAQVATMQNEPESFLGKTVKMQGTFLVGEGETRNYYYCLVADAAACCQQGFEFLWDGHIYPDDYPEPGSQIIVEGVFDTYWEDGYQYMQLINASLKPV